MKIKSIFFIAVIILLAGCSQKPLSGSSKILEIPSDSAAEGCEFIKKSRVLNVLGFGHDMHVANAKILMINDVIENNGNAYVQHYLSAGLGEAGNASFSIYKCPDEFNNKNSKLLKNTDNNYKDKLEELKNMYKNELITKDEYDKKRKELLDKF